MLYITFRVYVFFFCQLNFNVNNKQRCNQKNQIIETYKKHEHNEVLIFVFIRCQTLALAMETAINH